MTLKDFRWKAIIRGIRKIRKRKRYLGAEFGKLKSEGWKCRVEIITWNDNFSSSKSVRRIIWDTSKSEYWAEHL